jgi:hypothetical protein
LASSFNNLVCKTKRFTVKALSEDGLEEPRLRFALLRLDARRQLLDAARHLPG